MSVQRDGFEVLAQMVGPQFIATTLVVALGLYLSYMEQTDAVGRPLGVMSIIAATALMALCLFQLWSMPVSWKTSDVAQTFFGPLQNTDPP